MKDKDFVEVSEYIKQQRSNLLSSSLLERVTESGFVQATQTISQSSDIDLDGSQNIYEVELRLCKWLGDIYSNVAQKVPYPDIVRVLEIRHEFRNMKIAFEDFVAPLSKPPIYVYVGQDTKEFPNYFMHQDPFETSLPDYLIKPTQAAIKEIEHQGFSLVKAKNMLTRAMYKKITDLALNIGNSYIIDTVQIMIDLYNSLITLKIKTNNEPIANLEPLLIDQGKTPPSFFSSAYTKSLATAIPAAYHKQYSEHINFAVKNFESTEDFMYFTQLFGILLESVAKKVEIVNYGAEVPFAYLIRAESEARKVVTVLSCIKQSISPDTIKAYLQLNMEK